MAGAVSLAGMATLRGGAGLVTLAVPEQILSTVAALNPCYMTIGLASDPAGHVAGGAREVIENAAGRATAIALGPGLGRSPALRTLVAKLYAKLPRPMVVDADGLNAIAEDVELLRKRALPMIVTPHPGEMGRLIRQSAADVQRDRERIARGFAKRYNVIVVLKGHGTVVASFDGSLYVNDTGNPGMASGGCGDVLTGMIAGLLGQQLSLFDASCLSVYLHGLAGDLAAKERGETGLIASDVVDRIPLAIREYQSSPT